MKDLFLRRMLEAGAPMLVNMACRAITPAKVRQLAGQALDAVEDLAARTDNELDDLVVAHACAVVREALGLAGRLAS